MPTLTRIAAKYGYNQPIPVEALPSHKREITQMVHSISERIQQTIAHLESITDLRRTRAADVKAPMARKHRGNVVIKVGYGTRNETICADLPSLYFPTCSQALEYLRAVDEVLNEGALDDALAVLLNQYRERAAHARAQRTPAQRTAMQIIKNIELPQHQLYAAE